MSLLGRPCFKENKPQECGNEIWLSSSSLFFILSLKYSTLCYHVLLALYLLKSQNCSNNFPRSMSMRTQSVLQKRRQYLPQSSHWGSGPSKTCKKGFSNLLLWRMINIHISMLIVKELILTTVLGEKSSLVPWSVNFFLYGDKARAQT